MKTQLFIAFIIAALLIYYLGSRFFDRIEARLSIHPDHQKLSAQISSIQAQIEDLHQRMDLEPQLRDAARMRCNGADRLSRFWARNLELEYERVLGREYKRPPCSLLTGRRQP